MISYKHCTFKSLHSNNTTIFIQKGVAKQTNSKVQANFCLLEATMNAQY
jgi:hypothetical protein